MGKAFQKYDGTSLAVEMPFPFITEYRYIYILKIEKVMEKNIFCKYHILSHLVAFPTACGALILEVFINMKLHIFFVTAKWFQQEQTIIYNECVCKSLGYKDQKVVA